MKARNPGNLKIDMEYIFDLLMTSKLKISKLQLYV